MRIFHIAERSRWEAAKTSGSYAQSTWGRTLEDEGFIHAARADQWEDVRRRHYAEVSAPLVLLEIDTDRLTSPWREDEVGGTTYPHIHGPLNPSAVVAERPLPARRAAGAPAGSVSFAKLFLGEMVFRMGAAIGLMLLVGILASVGSAIAGEPGALAGLVAGLAVGIPVWVHLARRREARLAQR